MSAYYNENDPFAAAWLRALIADGQIAKGEVDERSIADVQASDLAGRSQCHFFAGIGGWSYALRLAGWPDDRPVWTGSCPCQPFSCAGKGAGGNDARHLWPEWFRLIRECRPSVVFGEQVEAAIGHGWLDLVCSDLEGQGYACGAVVLPAAGVGAPHARHRLWFVGDADKQGPQGRRMQSGAEPGERATRQAESSGELAYADHSSATRQRADGGAVTSSTEVPITRQRCDSSAWAAVVWVQCRDGKSRPTQPGLHPLAARVPGRVGRLRGYGNSIVPQVAAEVIAAYMDTRAGATA